MTLTLSVKPISSKERLLQIEEELVKLNPNNKIYEIEDFNIRRKIYKLKEEKENLIKFTNVSY